MQLPFSRRLRRPLKKRGMLRGHLALRQGDCVPLHPLLNSYEEEVEGDTLSSVRASVLWLHKESRQRGDSLRDSYFAEGPFLDEASKLMFIALPLSAGTFGSRES
jgi:hypothetical protein